MTTLTQALKRTVATTATIALGVLAIPGVVNAATLNFNFSFTNTRNGGGSGQVTGIVRGLEDNATSAASSIEVLTNTEGFGIGEYVSHPLSNSFTVTNGAIATFNFVSFGSQNSFPAVTSSALALLTVGGGLGNAPNQVSITRDASPITFSLAIDPETESVPEPSTVIGTLVLSAAAWRMKKWRCRLDE